MPATTVNEYRTARVAELLSDFRTLQYYIAAAPVNPVDMDDYYTEGWAALRQCALDGQHILNCAADVTVPCAMGGPEEQAKAELKQCVFFFFSFLFLFFFPLLSFLDSPNDDTSLVYHLLLSFFPLSLTSPQGQPRRVRTQARRTKDLPPTDGVAALDRMAGPDPHGRQAALREPGTSAGVRSAVASCK